MTKRELEKLNRHDLIEMLLEITRENEQLRKSLADAKKQLRDRTLVVSESGSLAEAALRLNGVFEAAQAAADQYLENVKKREDEQRLICIQMEQDTREKCDAMMEDARKQVDDYLEQINAHLREVTKSMFWKPTAADSAKDTEGGWTL